MTYLNSAPPAESAIGTQNDHYLPDDRELAEPQGLQNKPIPTI